MQIKEVYVPKEKVMELLDEYVSKNKIEIKNECICFNGEASGKVGYAAAMRFCYLMLVSEDPTKNKFANNAFEQITMYDDGFAAVTFCRILKNYRQRLSALAEKRIIDSLKNMRDIHISDYFDFQGVNDNFPLMAVYYCMIFGEFMNDRELLDAADRRFKALEGLIKRRGTLSEYCSASYTPLQLSVLSSLVNDAICDRYREIALATELRVWADYISHFNPETGLLSGPFSRTYTYTLTGENPSSELFFNLLLNPKTKVEYGRITEQAGSYMVFATLYYSSFKYHLISQLEDLLYKREYPFRYEATAETSSSTDEGPGYDPERDIYKEDNFYEYQGGEIQQHLYMTENYSIGTATREFHNGMQTDSYFVSYKKKDLPSEMSDIRNVFARYIVNDKGIGEGFISDHGRKTAIQHDNCAMVLYKPKLLRRMNKDKEFEVCDISSLRLCVFIHKKFSVPDQIILGDKILCGFNGTSQNPESIFIKDGKVFMAFHPLCLDDRGRSHAVEVKDDGEYIIISLYNYSGNNKRFYERDLLHIRNGFVCQISSSDEIGSFEEFVQETKKHTISDEYIKSLHTRQTFTRKVVFEKDNLSLSCEYNPASEGIKNIVCNDRIITAEKMRITGFDGNVLPYM